MGHYNYKRRSFLKSLSAWTVAAALPGIARAMSVPANNRTGTIADVGHIIILMQENRSFDHYFGTLRGVRGFADPCAVTLPSGRSVWHQPHEGNYVLPFRPDAANLGSQFLPDVPHGWEDSHAAWNMGNYDQWIRHKGIAAMTYYTRADIPYHYALADAFTICDAYYCSVMGPTDPNRYYMWTGWTGNDGNGGGPVVTNAEAGYAWSTFPERLQKNGISWKIYQDIGNGLDAQGKWGWTEDPYIGNYGDNALLYFHQYRDAAPGNPLADYAKIGTNILAHGHDPFRLLDLFRHDVSQGRLPQVSWIVAPEAYSEHPNFPPNYGAWYISQVIDILVSKPEVWSKSVLFITYDEGGGLFDHVVPPTPAYSKTHGGSTVDTRNEFFQGVPYGLGTRVPMLVVSPWSKGGWVNSQVFDHTSLIRFIEARFAKDYPGLIESNITPWRRAVAGDLTTAFNFATPNASPVSLPDVSGYLPLDKRKHPDFPVSVPVNQDLPHQEPGVRLARALPYALHARARINLSKESLVIEFGNSGEVAGVFQVRSPSNDRVTPRTYTVEAGKRLVGTWTLDMLGAPHFDLAVYGPNGFFRAFKGSLRGPGKANLDVQDHYDKRRNSISLTISNLAKESARVRIVNNYTGERIEAKLGHRQILTNTWPLARSFGWYDLLITVESDPGFMQRIAGHVETGRDSVSDPAMGHMPVRE